MMGRSKEWVVDTIAIPYWVVTWGIKLIWAIAGAIYDYHRSKRK